MAEAVRCLTPGGVMVPPLRVPPPLPEEEASEAASTGRQEGSEATNPNTDGLRAELAEARSMLAEARDALVEARGLANSWGSHDGTPEVPVRSTEQEPSVSDCLEVERKEFLSLQKDLEELREWVQAESQARVTALSQLQDVGVLAAGTSPTLMLCKQGAAEAGAGGQAA